MLIRYSLVGLLLAVIVSLVVLGEKVKSPTDFIRNFVFGIKGIESYVETELLLEKYAEKAHLFQLPNKQRRHAVRKLLEKPFVQDTIQQCKRFKIRPKCDGSPYRSFNGTCNNLEHPLWGSAVTKQDRLLPPFYVGQKGFRKSVTGHNLPPPRIITLKLRNRSNKSPLVSALFIFFGQLLVHDVTLTPVITINGTAPKCCSPQLRGNEACRPIILPRNDPFYSKFHVTCLNFVRSAPNPNCNFEKRSPMDVVTAFIDASPTYGSNIWVAKSLRELDGSGRLKTQNSEYGELMPRNSDEETVFCLFEKMENCFLSGDVRANQHTIISALHVMYLRLHNKYADKLRLMNHQWSEEKLYQEVRRIVGAVQQKIVYDEYLPLLLSEDLMKKYNLKTDFQKGSYYYDTVRPIDLVEFSTAAFRLHSMVPTEISAFDPKLKFRDTFSYNTPIFKGKAPSLITGSSEVLSEKNDPSVVYDISGNLYKPPGADYAFDLPSTNVQRGRDHGLPPYVHMVTECSEGFLKIQRFADLNKLMGRDNVALLRNIYRNVMDIDLWIGLIMEKPVAGTVSGPTAACIMAIQFYRFKFGDSFFFTHKNGRNPFSKEQMQSLQTGSLAQMICETLSTSKVRRYPLRAPGERNPLVLCEKIPSLDLKPWKEEKKEEKQLKKEETEEKNLKEGKKQETRLKEEEKEEKKGEKKLEE